MYLDILFYFVLFSSVFLAFVILQALGDKKKDSFWEGTVLWVYCWVTRVVPMGEEKRHLSNRQMYSCAQDMQFGQKGFAQSHTVVLCRVPLC